MLLQIETDPAAQAEVVDGVMGQVVAEIARNKSREERRKIVGAQDLREKEIKECRERYAHDRRHHESRGIVGIIMMDTVKKEMNLWRVYSVKLHTSIPMTNSANT